MKTFFAFSVGRPSAGVWRHALHTAALVTTLGLAACGGGGGVDGSSPQPSATSVAVSPAPTPSTPPSGATTTTPAPTNPTPGATTTPATVTAPAPPVAAMSQKAAVRLANQASFGPTEAMIEGLRSQGAQAWIAQQMAVSGSRYTSGGTSAVNQYTGSGEFCDGRGEACWRDWYSSAPLLWDFYRNAVSQPDQLRQRVALALQQIVVVSNLEVFGTYGLRGYQNMLLERAFGNYRDILRSVAVSPVMGSYLDNVNNDKAAPNENFARELLQLFALGTCELNTDGSLKGGVCQPTYDNETVRNYAYALTGWTYPKGGATSYGCWPSGANCEYYEGDMVPLPAFHDTQARALLGGRTLASGHSATVALEAVLDSLMAHPNMAPFIGKQLIQHLVTSNPSAAYVARVAAAFRSGSFQGFGEGRVGDMKATVAAVLLDAEARNDNPGPRAGMLREPALFFTGMLRALGGRTDGDPLSWWWGEELRQHMFRSPSVFNFYPPDYPLAGTPLVGPAFGIHNANSALQRINFINYLTFWNGSQPDPTNVPNATGTLVNLQSFVGDAADPAKLVDRLSLLALGEPLPTASRNAVIQAVSAYTQQNNGDDHRLNRVRQAAYLVFASPQYQIAR